MTGDRKKTDEPESGFLSRWSRRKRGEAPDEQAPDEQAPPEPAAAPEDSQGSSEEEENRKAAEAVDLESLTYESDYNLFLKPGVPADLRGRALRKLWRSNPLLANLDGLNDYDEDFTTPRGAAQTAIKTAWRVGQGFLEETEVQRPGAKTEAAAPETEPAETEPADSQARPEASTSLRAPDDSAPSSPETEDAPQEDQPAAEATEAALEESEAPPRRVGIRARLDLEAFHTPSSES